MSLASDAPQREAVPNQSAGALRPRLARPPHRLALSQTPTAVERAPWLDAGRAEVWVKRDDQTSAIYGGGKVRKLEWILANPPYDTDAPIVSVGGIGSHHLLALALFLREQGRSLHALTFTQTPTTHVRTNLATMVSLGARIQNVPSRALLPLAYLAYYTWARPKQPGRYMAAGASTALGCYGFVEAGLELAAQIEAGELPKPRTIYITAGSAGASAGLALGLALAGISTHLHLVSSVERLIFNRFLYRRKMNEAWASLRSDGIDHDAPSSEVLLRSAGITFEVDHSQVGGGYGVPTADASAALELASGHGLGLETTYTGKCVAALRRAETRNNRPGPVLFWNTHGSNDLSDLIDPDWRERCPVRLPQEER